MKHKASTFVGAILRQNAEQIIRGSDGEDILLSIAAIATAVTIVVGNLFAFQAMILRI